MIPKPVTSILSLLLLASFILPAAATTLDDLEHANKVKIRTWVEPKGELVYRQQINLQIEIATDKWFSGGTRVYHH